MRSTLPLFALALAASAPAVATEVVPVQQFRSIELRGGGDVSIVPGPVQRVTLLQGSTSYTRFHVEPNGKLMIDACYRNCPRNFDLRIRIETPDVPILAISGGGAITTAPGFRQQERLVAAVSGGGTINARALNVVDATAAVNGGGRIFVRPREALTAAVHGGGEVRYGGNPQVSMAIAGGGDVRRED